MTTADPSARKARSVLAAGAPLNAVQHSPCAPDRSTLPSQSCSADRNAISCVPGRHSAPRLPAPACDLLAAKSAIGHHLMSLDSKSTPRTNLASVDARTDCMRMPSFPGVPVSARCTTAVLSGVIRRVTYDTMPPPSATMPAAARFADRSQAIGRYQPIFVWVSMVVP